MAMAQAEVIYGNVPLVVPLEWSHSEHRERTGIGSKLDLQFDYYCEEISSIDSLECTTESRNAMQ